jgi:hypothetical protein
VFSRDERGCCAHRICDHGSGHSGDLKLRSEFDRSRRWVLYFISLETVRKFSRHDIHCQSLLVTAANGDIGAAPQKTRELMHRNKIGGSGCAYCHLSAVAFESQPRSCGDRKLGYQWADMAILSGMRW